MLSWLVCCSAATVPAPLFSSRLVGGGAGRTRDECVGPGSVIGEAQLGLMAGTHDHASDVEQAVAEPLGLCGGDGEVAVEVEVRCCSRRTGPGRASRA